MKKLLSILGALSLTTIACSSVIACNNEKNQKPESTKKIELNLENLESKLKFEKIMNGKEAYNKIRESIVELSNKFYKSVDEIKKDDTI